MRCLFNRRLFPVPSKRPCLQGGRVTLARGVKDSPGLQAKFTGRVNVLLETTQRLLRFGNLACKARTDNKTGKYLFPKQKYDQIVKELDVFWVIIR